VYPQTGFPTVRFLRLIGRCLIWLDHASLSLPDLTFARHQTVAEQHGDAPDSASSRVALPIRPQHVFGELGVSHQLCGRAVETCLENVAQLPERLSIQPRNIRRARKRASSGRRKYPPKRPV
jgi:hypothetical protein